MTPLRQEIFGGFPPGADPGAPTPEPAPDSTRLPGFIIGTVVALCVLPRLLMWLGVDLSALDDGPPGDAASPLATSLAGPIVHTLFEWTAFAVVAGVALLAFCHFVVARDATTPILGMALFCSGAVDAFHALAADRIVAVAAESEDLIPFTWFLSRTFNATILIVGAAIFLMRKDAASGRESPSRRRVFVACIAFVVAAYALIHMSAVIDEPPQTTFPGELLTRPWDVAPLVLYAIAGLFVYRRFSQAHPSLFSHALLVSAVPAIASQLHMAFGSEALHDAHFNAAHGLKVLAYAVPLVGLALDSTRKHASLVRSLDEVQRVREALQRSEAPLRRLYDSNIIGIMFADIHGNIFDANDALLEMIGYDRSELPISWIDMTPEEWLARDEEAVRECHERGVVPVWEKEYFRKDGSRVPILLAVAMLDMEAGTCICPVLDLSERSRLEKAVLEQSETERRRLGQDLHDGLGQHLTGVAFLTKALEQRLERREADELDDATRIRTLAEKAVSMARTMAQLVCPADLESDGLGPALTRLADNIESVFGVRCEYRHDDSAVVQDDTTATHLFHIAQEAITNGIKHGRATSIRVDLAVDDEELALTITDDGVGMPARPNGSRGMGLDIMRHRARMIGAKLRHSDGPGGGTVVSCCIPKPANIR